MLQETRILAQEQIMRRPTPSARGQIDDGWFVLAAILIDRFSTASGSAKKKERSPGTAGLISRFWDWWSRPSANTARTGSSPAIDAATHLEIRSLGGMPR